MNKATIKELKKAPGRLVEMCISSRRDPFTIIADYLILRYRMGLEFNEYFDFEFEKGVKVLRDTYLCTKEKLKYLSYLNSLDRYYILARNKYLTYLLFKNQEIPSAELLLYYDPMMRSPEENYCSTLKEVEEFLISNNPADFITKPAESSWGRGVMAFNRVIFENGSLWLESWDGKTLRLEEIVKQIPLLFEKKVRQTEQLNAINSSSTNTIRFWTTLHPGGKVVVINAVIKFGRSFACVDNCGHGGNIDAVVDLETGKMHRVMNFLGYRKMTPVTRHPDSKERIEGVVIENWAEIIEQLKGFHRRIPFLKVIAWDIAITDKGAVAIEINDIFDNTGQGLIGKGWKYEVRECYKDWKLYDERRKTG